MNSDREARKKALEAAKERLAYRRKQKEQLQLLRQQKQSGGSTGFDNPNTNYRKNDYGKKLVNDTKQLINEWTNTTQKEEQKLMDELNANDDSKSNAKQIVPGPRADLSLVHSVNTIGLMKRSRVEYVKEVQTDSVEIGQHAKIITEDTKNDELNHILATFIENDVYPWPNQKEQIIKRLTVDDKDSKQKESDELDADDDDDDKDDDKEEEKEMSILSKEAQIKLITPTFIKALQNKAQLLETALGINEEHSVFIEAHSTIRDMTENSEMEKLIKTVELSFTHTNGRAITSLDYDFKFGDRFLASYSGYLAGGSAHLAGDGLIHIYDMKSDANGKLIRRLECQSMINCAEFHPTKDNMIIGASVSGQVLGWDMRTKKKTPSIRTQFSSSSHTQPIFALSFLPSMSYMPSTKIQQILTLSNDAKLCIWRDDMLYKPNNEFLLKLSKMNVQSQSQSQTITSSTNQAKEITTTCFAYPNKHFNENKNKIWLGSDEGCIYETNLNLNLNKNDEKELPITSYIADAHHGPITCIDFHKDHKLQTSDHKLQNNLYLTSSFDWTVKLWHSSSTKPVALFNTMQDYVYDVKWSPTNPSIFAAGDGSGNLTIFDLNSSFEHPASEPTNITSSERPIEVNPSITKLLWTPNGKQIIAG
eukprot:470254_1